MNIVYTDTFRKHFSKRIKPHHNLNVKFSERVNLFIISPNNPILKDHPLRGRHQELRAFSITGDIRVVYFIKDNITYFADIGTHNQVY